MVTFILFTFWLSDTLIVPYRNKKYAFNVLEVKPGRAISIFESELTTEFAPPLSGDVTSYPTPTADITAEPTSSTTSTTSTTTTAATSTTTSPAAASPAKGEATGRLEVTSEQKEGVDYKVCDNCRQKIPIAAFTMHSISCARMNWFCTACGVVVQKAQKVGPSILDISS
jgi:hypothetical protein